MLAPALASAPVTLQLMQPDGREVRPLWLVLATLRKHGFRTVAPMVRSGLAGSWFLATAVYQGAQHEAASAMRAACAELEYADALMA
ncbi:hypothetical protein BWP39_03240 [Paraburkholderia acidicola]|uniref:Uncharacterized protein n=1 Tax=Paraburkholderia acidicola TaxID=1912599 RepID=A0A2A4F2D7_9BURK|nr:hypothetical protein BWP39_03240 [Paraburkholderia acidicola]